MYAIPHIPHIPHTPCKSSTYVNSHTAHDTPHTAHLKKMDEATKNQATRVFPCTPENQRDMAAAVKAWPQLHALVKDLQAQNLFPGLRAMRIRITGSPELVAQGLGAIATLNATKAD